MLQGRPGTAGQAHRPARGGREDRDAHHQPGDHRRPQRPGRPPQARRLVGLHARQGQEDRLHPHHQLHPGHRRGAQEGARRAEGEGMKGLVLDLRDNPGGLLELGRRDLRPVRRGRARSSAPRGGTPASKAYDGREGRDLQPSFPMVVLVNQNSASAAEIVSACLQDHKRAMVVGQRSYGKGSVQNILDARGRQQRPEADRGDLLAPLRQEHPPVQERQGDRRVGRLARPRPRGQAPRSTNTGTSPTAATATSSPATTPPNPPPPRPTRKPSNPSPTASSTRPLKS